MIEKKTNERLIHVSFAIQEFFENIKKAKQKPKTRKQDKTKLLFKDK